MFIRDVFLRGVIHTYVHIFFVSVCESCVVAVTVSRTCFRRRVITLHVRDLFCGHEDVRAACNYVVCHAFCCDYFLLSAIKMSGSAD